MTKVEGAITNISRTNLKALDIFLMEGIPGIITSPYSILYICSIRLYSFLSQAIVLRGNT